MRLQQNAVAASTVLFNVSLLGGFGASRINAVLRCTGYLSHSRDSSCRRLTETAQMVTDVVAGPASLRPGGEGWSSAVSVRLLHAAVRTGLLDAGCWDTLHYGLPINVTDAALTVHVFSTTMCAGMERLGAAWCISSQAMCDYLHLWRFTGSLLGVPDAATAALDTLPAAFAAWQSLALFTSDPDVSTRELVLASIRGEAYRPPVPCTPREQAASCRAACGDALADALGCPRIDDPALDAMDRDIRRRPDPGADSEGLLAAGASHDMTASAGGYIGSGAAASIGERMAGAIIGFIIALLWLAIQAYDTALWLGYAACGRSPPESRLFVRLPQCNTARDHALPQWSKLYALPLLMAVASPMLEPLQFAALRSMLVGRLGARSIFALKFPPQPPSRWESCGVRLATAPTAGAGVGVAGSGARGGSGSRD